MFQALYEIVNLKIRTKEKEHITSLTIILVISKSPTLINDTEFFRVKIQDWVCNKIIGLKLGFLEFITQNI